MRRLYTKAYAKLNLSLDITGLRPDGYHELIMVMQTTTLYDNVALERLTEAEGIRSRSNLRYIPNDSRNLAVKAATWGSKLLRPFLNIRGSVPVFPSTSRKIFP